MTFSHHRFARLIPALGLLLFVSPASSDPTSKPPKPEHPTPGSVAQHPENRHLERGQYLARTALSFRGAHYRMGGHDSSGFDCSGLTQTVYKKWGLLLPRTSTEQFTAGQPVAKSDIQPGDLVFFKNTYKSGISHVGIYVGDGKMLHAVGSGKGVQVSPLSSKYHAEHYAGARRLNLDKMPVPATE